MTMVDFPVRPRSPERPVRPAEVAGERAAADDGDRQTVAILTAVLSDGLPAVEAACEAALREGVHSADVVLNILARQREPAAAAITVITPPPASPTGFACRSLKLAPPDALRLRHEPSADCARYDSLRRAG